MNLNNISQIRYGGKDIVLGKLNGNIIYEKSIGPEQPEDSTESYYIEYTVASSPKKLNDGVYVDDALKECKYGLPRIYSDNNTYSYTYDKVEITLTNGTTTDNLNTACSNVRKIKLWYPKDTKGLIFRGSGKYKPLVKTVDYIKTDNFTTMDYMFCNCSSLTSLDVSNFNTSKVSNMSYMFYGCYKLTSLDLSGFNTSKVTSMDYMFETCRLLTSLDLSGFNTSMVTDMSCMFSNCSGLTSLDLSGFNTSKVTNMQSMFNHCQSLKSINVSNFDTSNVTSMDYIFNNCISLNSLDLSSWDISNVHGMSYMFYYCTSLNSLDLSSWDTSNVTDMNYMFSGCSASIYGGYKFAIKGSCNNMFEYFSGSIYDIGYGEIYSSSYMFANSNIDDYTFSNIFYYNCNFSNCSDMSYMFYNCTNLYSFHFDDSSNHSTHSLCDVSYMFAGCTRLYELYINYMNTQNVYNYEGMFADVSDSCNIYVGSDFTLTESDTGFNGYFQHY